MTGVMVENGFPSTIRDDRANYNDETSTPVDIVERLSRCVGQVVDGIDTPLWREPDGKLQILVKDFPQCCQSCYKLVCSKKGIARPPLGFYSECCTRLGHRHRGVRLGEEKIPSVSALQHID